MQEIANECLCHVEVGKITASSKRGATKVYKYISRLDATKGREDLVFSKSINMPEFAKGDPALFWKMAKKHESSQGRLAVLIEIALPRELTDHQNIQLMNFLIQELTTHDEGSLPCSYAFHYKKESNNPHFHAMIYERPLCEANKYQPPELFFKKANRNNPSKGGAKKVKKFVEKDFPKWLRHKWAMIANIFLELFGAKRRMNPLSYKERGINITPQIHLGPRSSYNLKQGIIDTRITKYTEVQRLNTLNQDKTSSNPRPIEESFTQHWKSLEIPLDINIKMKNIIYQLISETHSKSEIIKLCIAKDQTYLMHDWYDSEELYNLYSDEYDFIFERIHNPESKQYLLDDFIIEDEEINYNFGLR